jgi:hypothetical protein
LVRRATTDYQPSFIEDIIAQNPTYAQQVNQSCNFIESCLVAILSSGINSIGAQAIQSVQQYQTAQNSLCTIYFNFNILN